MDPSTVFQQYYTQGMGKAGETQRRASELSSPTQNYDVDKLAKQFSDAFVDIIPATKDFANVLKTITNTAKITLQQEKEKGILNDKMKNGFDKLVDTINKNLLKDYKGQYKEIEKQIIQIQSERKILDASQKAKIKELELKKKDAAAYIATIETKQKYAAAEKKLLEEQKKRIKEANESFNNFSKSFSDNLKGVFTGKIGKIPMIGDALANSFSQGWDKKVAPKINATLAKMLFKHGKIEEGLSIPRLLSLISTLGLATVATAGLVLAIGGLVVVLGTAYKLFKAIFDKAVELDAYALKIGKSFGLASGNAVKMAGEIQTVSRSLMFMGIETEKIQENAGALLRSFGTIQGVTSSNLITVTKLTERWGVAAETGANMVMMLQRIMGYGEKQTDTFFSQLQGEASIAGVSFGGLVEDIANNMELWVTAGVKNVSNLTKAAIQAKKMGMSLDVVSKIQEGFEDLESTIEKSQYINFITGRNLNPMKLYSMSQMGDVVGLMEEAFETAQSMGQEFNNLPITVQKKLAEMFNISVVEFSKMSNMSRSAFEKQQKQTKDWAASLKQINDFWEQLKAVGVGIMTSVVIPFAEALKPLVKNWREGLTSIGDRLRKVFSPDKTHKMITSIANSIQKVFYPEKNLNNKKGFWETVGDGIELIATKFQEFFTLVDDTGQTKFEKLLTGMKKFYEDYLSKIVEAFKDIFDPDTYAKGGSFWSTLLGAIENLIDSIKEPLADMVSYVLSSVLGKPGRFLFGLDSPEEIKKKMEQKQKIRDIDREWKTGGYNDYFKMVYFANMTIPEDSDLDTKKKLTKRKEEYSKKLERRDELIKQRDTAQKELNKSESPGLVSSIMPWNWNLGYGGGGVYAKGGYVRGPGTGTSDSIPANLSNGEFVVNAKGTSQFRPLLETMNLAAGSPSTGASDIFNSMVELLESMNLNIKFIKTSSDNISSLLQEGLFVNSTEPFLKNVWLYYDHKLLLYKKQAITEFTRIQEEISKQQTSGIVTAHGGVVSAADGTNIKNAMAQERMAMKGTGVGRGAKPFAFNYGGKTIVANTGETFYPISGGGLVVVNPKQQSMLNTKHPEVIKSGRMNPAALDSLKRLFPKFKGGNYARGGITGNPDVVTINDIYLAAKKYGDPHPEVTAGQWALESGWGRHPSGKFNYFGIKGKGSLKRTKEFLNGKWVTITSSFRDYGSLDEGIKDRIKLITSGRYKAYNTAQSTWEAILALKKGGYWTDPTYEKTLFKIIQDRDWINGAGAPPGEYVSKMMENGNVEQNGFGYASYMGLGFPISSFLMGAIPGPLLTGDTMKTPNYTSTGLEGTTNISNEYLTSAGTNNGSFVTDASDVGVPGPLMSFFYQRLKNAMKETGEPFTGSGSRTHLRQIELKKEKGKWAATPGNSRHEYGLAVDLVAGNFWRNQKDNKELLKYGLDRPMFPAGRKSITENWHIEPVGPNGDRIPISAGTDKIFPNNTLANGGIVNAGDGILKSTFGLGNFGMGNLRFPTFGSGNFGMGMGNLRFPTFGSKSHKEEHGILYDILHTAHNIISPIEIVHSGLEGLLPTISSLGGSQLSKVIHAGLNYGPLKFIPQIGGSIQSALSISDIMEGKSISGIGKLIGGISTIASGVGGLMFNLLAKPWFDLFQTMKDAGDGDKEALDKMNRIDESFRMSNPRYRAGYSNWADTGRAMGGIITAANGFNGIVDSPTMFLAGETGMKEHVDIKNPEDTNLMLDLLREIRDKLPTDSNLKFVEVSEDKLAKNVIGYIINQSQST